MQGTNRTVFGWYCMVTVPLQIQVSMSWLSIYSSAEASIFIRFIKMSKKGMDPSSLWSSLVNCMFYQWN